MYYIKIRDGEGLFADALMALDYKRKGYLVYESAEIKKEVSEEDIKAQIEKNTVVTHIKEEGAST